MYVAAPPIEDLFPLTGQVVLQDGRDSAHFEIFVRDDEIPEVAEHFVLSLTYSDKGKINDKNNSIEIIVSGNDSPVRFSHSTKRVLERDGKANDIEVHVTRGLDETGSKRIGPDAGEVVVDYKVVANSATPNEDYNVADGAVRFLAGVHNASIKVLIMPDDIPEVAENFTITLLPSTVYGDAIVTSPDHCVITIETNDKANGVLSIDFSDAIMNEKDGDKKVFIADEDDNEKFSGIRIMRHGGSFKTVSIQWTLDSIGESNPSKLMPTLGEIIFESGETEKLVEFEIAQDALPQESMKYVFRLLASTIKGGAELDGNTEADIYVPDSDNVYGLINIRRGSKIDVDNESNQRNVLLTVERSGGVVGKINVTYSAYYLPPEATQIRDAMPGILENPTGFIVLNDGVDKEEVSLKIGDLAFLQTGASFEIRLETVDLLDRSPSILPKTPRLGDRSSITLLVNEEQANSEVGFADPKQVEVEEPSDDPLIVEVEITREGR
uniref:adhesion G-protein coupled receptor V1-like n=1 Tax=Styela clava TaxID=7725 RepID=UPI0019395BF0|nr:adhesion G-protein coupled receptor V1-like [Styela clava]